MVGKTPTEFRQQRGGIGLPVIAFELGQPLQPFFRGLIFQAAPKRRAWRRGGRCRHGGRLLYCPARGAAIGLAARARLHGVAGGRLRGKGFQRRPHLTRRR